MSTVAGRRWQNTPSLARYMSAQGRPPRTFEELPPAVQQTERLMLGLRLDRPLALDDVGEIVDRDALARLERGGLLVARGRRIVLTDRGRFVGGAVTARLLA